MSGGRTTNTPAGKGGRRSPRNAGGDQGGGVMGCWERRARVDRLDREGTRTVPGGPRKLGIYPLIPNPFGTESRWGHEITGTRALPCSGGGSPQTTGRDVGMGRKAVGVPGDRLCGQGGKGTTASSMPH